VERITKWKEHAMIMPHYWTNRTSILNIDGDIYLIYIGGTTRALFILRRGTKKKPVQRAAMRIELHNAGVHVAIISCTTPEDLNDEIRRYMEWNKTNGYKAVDADGYQRLYPTVSMAALRNKSIHRAKMICSGNTIKEIPFRSADSRTSTIKCIALYDMDDEKRMLIQDVATMCVMHMGLADIRWMAISRQESDVLTNRDGSELIRSISKAAPDIELPYLIAALLAQTIAKAISHWSDDNDPKTESMPVPKIRMSFDTM